MNRALIPILIAFLILPIIYNLLEICLEGRQYIKDVWNIFDLAANTLSTVYIVQYYTEPDEDDRLNTLAFANILCWMRLSGYFRLWEPTRYLMRMII